MSETRLEGASDAPRWKTLESALLVAYTGDELKSYAKLLGVRLPVRKADQAHAMADAVIRGAKNLWDKLDELQKSAVAEVVHGTRGAFDENTFAAKYGGLPAWRVETERYSYSGSPTLLGLFLLKAGHGLACEFPTIPADLAARLRDFVPAPKTEQLATLEIPESDDESLTVRETEQPAQRELFAVLRLVDMGRIQVGDKTLRPSAKSISEVSEVLVGGDFYGPGDQSKKKYAQEIGCIRPFAWPLILQAAGLAKASGARLALTPAGRTALGRPAPETLQKCWRGWVATRLLDEFNRVDVIKGQGKPRCLTAVAPRREVIDGVLRRCPVGRWIEVDELSRHMQATGSTFGVTHNPWKLYIADAQYGALGYVGYGGWSILQGRFLLALLFEYAATMGLVDVAYTNPVGAREDFTDNWGVDDLEFLSRYDGLRCFRINALGAHVLGMLARYEPPSTGASSEIRVLPNLDLVTTAGQFTANDEAFLSAYCERRSEAVFKLDRDSALGAIDKGHGAAELVGFLRRSSPGGLPDTVEAFLTDLERRASMLIEAGHAMLIECADEALALQIANDRKTRGLCRLAPPRTLVVPASGETAFKRAMIELGYPVQPPERGCEAAGGASRKATAPAPESGSPW